jgi:N-acetyl-anhydromuramyl-L-alanine amidase AmpD
VPGALKLKPAHLGLLLAVAILCPHAADAVTKRAQPKAASKPKTAQKSTKPIKKTAPAAPAIDPVISRQLAAIPVSGKWKYIVIHHSGISVGTPAAMDRYHRERGMENGLAYHFVIGNGHGMKDGQIYVGNRWKKQLQGGHLAIEELNQVSIGICLIGNFDTERPTPAQMASLQSLLRKLRSLTGLPATAITTHSVIHPKHTECPGRFFPSRNSLLLGQK